MIEKFSQVHTRLRLEDGQPLINDEQIRTPKDAVNLLAEHLKDMDREYVIIINLDTMLRPINFHILTMGGIDQCVIPTEKVFQSAILSNASAMMMLHNHPSGSLFISSPDCDTTKRLDLAGQIMGIPLLDHIIVAGKSGQYLSIRGEHPELFSQATAESIVMEEAPQRNRFEETMQRLEEGVKDVFSSDRYKEYLKTMGKFHHYSVNNSILIALQRPDASFVAGYTAWQKNFGRQVRKGEKAINIIAPIITKKTIEEKNYDAEGNEITTQTEQLIPHFKVGSVFDISQTYGPPLPTIAPSELVGKVCMYDDLMDIIKTISPVQLRFDAVDGGAKGYYSSNEKEIVIKEGMEEMATIKTVIHELVHATLHDKEFLEQKEQKKDRQTMEVEAESTAYVICSELGLSTDEYSFPYIAGWSADKETKLLKDSLATIRSTADLLLNQIEEQMHQLDRYEIYQISEKSPMYDHQFSSYEGLEGYPVKVSDYERVYMARLEDDTTLDGLYTTFNLNHPEDFKGHSLSVSDVIVLHRQGEDKTFYVDSFGYKQIDLFKEEQIHEHKIGKCEEKSRSHR